MSRGQKAVLTVGLLVFVVTALFPPWVGEDFATERERRGYAFLGTGPQKARVEVRQEPRRAGSMHFYDPYAHRGETPKRSGWLVARVDVPRLLIQWVTLAVVVGTLLVLLRGGRPLPTQATEDGGNEKEGAP